MRHRLVLDYTLTAGRLQPWLDGLRAGQAVGLACGACGQTSFPPQRRCTCGSMVDDWVTLAGTGTIAQRTDGPEDSFALVKFDGASALTTVRLENPETLGDRGRLAAVPDGPPAQMFMIDTEE